MWSWDKVWNNDAGETVCKLPTSGWQNGKRLYTAYVPRDVRNFRNQEWIEMFYLYNFIFFSCQLVLDILQELIGYTELLSISYFLKQKPDGALMGKSKRNAERRKLLGKIIWSRKITALQWTFTYVILPFPRSYERIDLFFCVFTQKQISLCSVDIIVAIKDVFI